MRYMLDTNILILLLNQRSQQTLARLKMTPLSDLYVSAITVGELKFGVYHSQRAQHNLAALEKFLLPFTVVRFDEAAADRYGVIRSQLQAQGNIIGPNDLFIAAHALSEGCILVTNNTREFQRVPQLVVEDWTLES